MNAIAIISCIVISYLLGSVPWGYLLTRWSRGIDIRKYGSGNIGFTNVLRVAGKPAAVLTLLLDFGKGWLAVTLFTSWFHSWSRGVNLEVFQIFAFTAVVGGHIFTIFLHFKGGKGIATGAGALLALSPLVFIMCVGLWLLLVALFRYVSLGSIVAAGALPFLIYFLERQPSLVIFSTLLAGLIIFRHKSNIKQLIKGKERKLGEKAKIERE